MNANQLLVMAVVALTATTGAIARVGCQMIEDPNLTFHQETESSDCQFNEPENPEEDGNCTGTCTKLVWEEPACKADEAPNSVAYCEGGIAEMFEADVSSGNCYVLAMEQSSCNCIPSPNEGQVQVAGTGIDAGFDEAGCGGTPGS